MATKKQLKANRKNAQKSTGPRTQQGMEIASQNSLKHGLRAQKNVIPTESQEEFDLHCEQMLTSFSPVGPMESFFAKRIIALTWRLRRADHIQNTTINTMNAEAASNPLARLTKSLLARANDQAISIDPPVSKPDLNLGRLIIKDFSGSGVIERLLMYERRIESSLLKTILQFQQLQLIRQMNASDLSDQDPIEPENLLCQTNPILKKSR